MEINDAKEATEAAIRATQRYLDELNDLYDHAPCGYHSLDKDGLFTRINDTELQWLGQPHPSQTTIMMLSSVAMHSDAEHCRQLGIAAYLVKPIKRAELLTAILTVLGRSGMPPAPAEKAVGVETSRRQHPLRILLVEDNVVNQKIATIMLQQMGHTVTTAHNGWEAIAMARREPVELILMDLQMPELDGLEATRNIRAYETPLGRHTPIIAMTAHALKGDRDGAWRRGWMGMSVSRSIRPALPRKSPASFLTTYRIQSG